MCLWASLPAAALAQQQGAAEVGTVPAEAVVQQGQQTGKKAQDLSRTHRGLFLRLTAGAGVRFLLTAEEADGEEGEAPVPQPGLGNSHKLVGADTPVALFAGWTINETLIVHGQVQAGFTSGLRGIGGDLGGSDVAAGYVAVGAGLTGYGVTDVYLTPTLSYVRLGWFDRGGGTPLPPALHGIMTGIQMGKEWWLRDHLLIGVGGRLDYQWLQSGDLTWHGLAAGALASLSIN